MLQTANNSKTPQLMERIKYLEEQGHQLEAEANDLREQNELLEFRILELEETNDKVCIYYFVSLKLCFENTKHQFYISLK